MLILDTNVISALRRPDRSPRIAAFLAALPEDSLFLSVITLGEIERHHPPGKPKPGFCGRSA